MWPFKKKPKQAPLQEVDYTFPPPWTKRNHCIKWWNALSTEDKELLESVMVVELVVRKQDPELYVRIRQCINPRIELRTRGYEITFHGEDSGRKTKKSTAKQSKN